MSILAARKCTVPHKYLMTVGLGTEGGISEYVFLEYIFLDSGNIT
jgi:hypothetical protein